MLRELLATEMPARQQEIRLRIAVAQGQVVCGTELFPLTGRPVQTAHTLAQQASDRSIVVSDELRRTLGEQVIAERAGDQPNSSWTVTSLMSSGTARGAFVGRHPELAMIVAAIDRCATTRRGRAVVLRGEAGMGKTRLADAIRQAAIDRGVAAHTAQVFDFGQSPGRGPVAQLALSLLGLAQDARPAQRSTAVTTVHARCRRQLRSDHLSVGTDRCATECGTRRARTRDGCRLASTWARSNACTVDRIDIATASVAVDRRGRALVRQRSAERIWVRSQRSSPAARHCCCSRRGRMVTQPARRGAPARAGVQ